MSFSGFLFHGFFFGGFVSGSGRIEFFTRDKIPIYSKYMRRFELAVQTPNMWLVPNSSYCIYMTRQSAIEFTSAKAVLLSKSVSLSHSYFCFWFKKVWSLYYETHLTTQQPLITLYHFPTQTYMLIKQSSSSHELSHFLLVS